MEFKSDVSDIQRWEDEGGACSGSAKSTAARLLHVSDKEKRSLKPGSLLEVPKYQQNECMRFLDKVPLKTIVMNREYIKKEPTRDYIGTELITVSSTDLLGKVVETLAQHRISCVPVIDHSESSTSTPGVFKGFVDMLDVISLLVLRAQKPFAKDRFAMQQAGKEIAQTAAVHVVDQCLKNEAFPVNEDHSVPEALRYFEKGVHRVPLFDSHKRLVGLCSQADLVRFLSDNFIKGVAVGMATRSLRDYGCLTWGPEPSVISIEPTATVQHAIGKMVMSGVQALAVVDPSNGVLLGSFSAWDITRAFYKGTDQQELYCRLSQTVLEFLEANGQELMQPLYDVASLSLESACKILSDHNAHHIWIVDSLETMVPVALCSLTDICRIVFNFEWPAWIS